jgi:hypothetical protein
VRHWRSRIGACDDLRRFTSRLRLDVAENLAAAFDLDLAVADRPRDPAGRLDAWPIRPKHQPTSPMRFSASAAFKRRRQVVARRRGDRRRAARLGPISRYLPLPLPLVFLDLGEQPP